MDNPLHRKIRTSKNDYGHVLLLAGSTRMVGAAYLAASGALLGGAGKVTLGMPKGIYGCLTRRLIEAMLLPLPQTPSGSLSHRGLKEILKFSRKVSAVGLGPGLTTQSATRHLVKDLIINLTCPIVIDADALNGLQHQVAIIKRAKSAVILTPHEGEFGRLSGHNLNSIRKYRKKVAKKFSHDYHCILVLKGHRTVVAEPGGRVYENTSGNPGMASGGTGDVLTGLISSFTAQGFDPFFASALGVYVHGAAGDEAAKKIGLTALVARDVLNYIPSVLMRLERKRGLYRQFM